MSVARNISSISEELASLELITRVFSEVASGRMKQTRDKVLSSRNYLQAISEIFDEVRASYAQEARKSALKFDPKTGKITFLSHNGKTVSVLLSANSGLYGSIVTETFDAFAKEVRENKTEVTIVGRLGVPLFTTVFPGKAYTYFEIDDRVRDEGALSSFARHIVQYDEIHLFYGKFHNIVVQKPDMLSITSQIDMTPQTFKLAQYIFEPDLASILQFFETQLFSSLLTQTVQESTLAKIASRVLAMDAASDRIKSERKKLQTLVLSAKHKELNKKQLNVLSGIMSMGI